MKTLGKILALAAIGGIAIASIVAIRRRRMMKAPVGVEPPDYDAVVVITEEDDVLVGMPDTSVR